MKFYADHFSRVAPAYASCRPRYPDELFVYLFQVCRGHRLAWDCAAGSGQATLPLTRAFQRVVATDLSPEMLASAPRHPRIEYRVAPAENSGLTSGSVDLITVAQALHWLEPDAFFAEAHRVLKRGAVLAAWTYGIQELAEPETDRILQRFYHEVVGPYWTPERRHVETGYRELPFPFLELKPPAFAMQAEWSLSELLGYVSTWSATQRFRETRGEDPVPELGRALRPEWGPPSTARTVRWPLSLRIGYSQVDQ
jgi:ubiquinone/menaquinone biosynthesis C-methylase UbiE